MEEKSQVNLKEQRDRRKRINRMKKGLISFIGIWMVVCMLLCVILMVKVSSLEKKVSLLVSDKTITKQVDEKVTADSAGGSDVLSYNSTEATESTNKPILMNIAGAINDTENLANENDELKVYLTFDDGPSDNTAAILDTLAKYNVKATFFVVGKQDDESKAMYQRIVNEGHTLGMHSYSHKYSVIYDSLDAFETDFNEIQSYLYDVTGRECRLYRFPGGSSNQVSNTDMTEFIKFLNEEQVTYFDWNVSSGDATSQAYTADELVNNVMSDVVKYKTSVVLMHDSNTKGTTVEALGPMIEALQGMGAQILPIDDNTTLVQHVKAESVE
ncbi:MAG: polysaccharide deacetylase family protein [Lachnospiraceae bacterium]|nr:polysaccharide deacetylase family protein [Lachnospiraceae bacterium]